MRDLKVECGWQRMTAVDRQEAQSEPILKHYEKMHTQHGEDLTLCDDWHCRCGNNTYTDGFLSLTHPIGGAVVAFHCNQCGILIAPDGHYLRGE